MSLRREPLLVRDDILPPVASPFPVLHALDLQLARAALEGSPEARRAFAQRMECVPRMLSAFNARLSRGFAASELEDLVQDTLVSIWRRLPSYQGLATLESWAWRFCQHHLANRLRARARAPVFVPVGDDAAEDGRTESLILFDVLDQALRRLEPGEALVVRLRHFEQLDFPAIGQRLDIPTNTARSRYYRALARLRNLLAPLRRREEL